MIITEAALAIIKDTVSLSAFGITGVRQQKRSRTSAAPFTTKAFAEAGLLTAYERGRGAAQDQGSVTARRTSGKR